MSGTRKVKVIGLGGIGSYLVEPLCRYLSYQPHMTEVTLVDGDVYEEKNKERQQFDEFANKALVTSNLLKQKFPRIHFRYKGEYVTDSNVISLIRENDYVFLCVDNHATRKIVSDRCEELDNVTLISGGNDYTDGNVIYYVRKDGEDVTLSPTALFPKIANPTDKNPGDLSDAQRQGCAREAESAPQLLFMNLAIASHMCNVYLAHEQEWANFQQVYVDIRTQRAKPSPDPLDNISFD
jgi:molybdopterin/thiamine biosynthesis adenylyltransferase